ncbi:hypothetical protein J2Z40_004015 [Cytobacillus eiseniae]|uniref:Lipoprotein n=1 Tax=Cytobacillus eiseniae TaxID=762947 RepID=A0ABS4RNL6_9BACI|nr:hypothetical protein [Cytobacillus eiseniae]MBP2243377.1 hypothetical protein [Cytobacillus eiseniae]
MKKKSIYLFLLLFIFVLSACSQSPDFKLYKGKSLRIAVIGELPKVREKHVSFKEISFNELTSEKVISFDAVFITKENLPKAAESQYAKIYLNSTIPFFFIQAKSHLPFIEEEIVYNESWKWTVGNDYAVGVLVDDELLRNWGFGLYNDKKNGKHIKDVYSRIFETIEKLNY